MRDILFKARRKDNGQWIVGYYAFMKPYYYIMPEGSYDSWYEICPETLCQYTGLTDRDGKKIWENDIVKKVDTNALGWHRERLSTVSFDENGYWLLMTTLGDGYWIGEFEKEQLKVIGNIFDNPELLEI